MQRLSQIMTGRSMVGDKQDLLDFPKQLCRLISISEKQTVKLDYETVNFYRGMFDCIICAFFLQKIKDIFCGVMKGAGYIKRLRPQQQYQKLQNFLLNYEDPNLDEEITQPYDKLGKYKYKIIMQKISNEVLDCMYIDIEDLEEMFVKEQERFMLGRIKSNVKHYITMLYEIVEKVRPKRNTSLNPQNTIRYELENCLRNQRTQNYQNGSKNHIMTQNQRIPNKMHRKYSVFFVYRNKKPGMVKSISELSSNMIGALTIVKGIVIRSNQVKPRIAIATYTCDVCGWENYLEVLNQRFTPLIQCQSSLCVENKVSGKLTFLPKHSQFFPSQEIKIQETPDQLRQGNIPRHMKLMLSDNNIKTAQPGDIIEIQGVIIPKKRQTNHQDQDLIFEICIQAFKVDNQKKKYVDMTINKQDEERIYELRSKYDDEQLFQKLSNAIAPEIYGLSVVKKALLLLLAGGVTTVTNDRMKIRGEINIMLVGDPGVAKSQLLKQISYLAPRGVYTTGKGSSDVGLTAAIKIDHSTKDVSLEAGALVLADMGVCCIDEFDKMDEYDRTAIHEVMEQQTVSIAKAGITTTLNARTSVLAASNPLFSRYNPKESTIKNINLPPALLSRFDLIFVLIDEIKEEKDLMMARHIGMVHKNKKLFSQENEIDPQTLRTYIALSKNYQPKINQELTGLLINRYIQQRAFYSSELKNQERYITTRHLLALIRLCQARARLRFSNEITKEDIEDCETIMKESQKEEYSNNKREVFKDEITKCFELIKEQGDYSIDREINMESLVKKAIMKGLKIEDINNTIKHYANLDVIMIMPSGNLKFV